MPNYLPIHRPGVVTFLAGDTITAGQLLQVSIVNKSVEPAEVGSVAIVGVAGHDAALGDRVAVEVNRTIHSLTAIGDIALGARVEAAVAGVRTVTTGPVFGIALAAATDGSQAQILQL